MRVKHCPRYMLVNFLIEFAICCDCFVGYLYPGGFCPESQPLSFACTTINFTGPTPLMIPRPVQFAFQMSRRSLHKCCYSSDNWDSWCFIAECVNFIFVVLFKLLCVTLIAQG